MILHKSLLTHGSGDLLTQLVFQLDLFSTHETFQFREQTSCSKAFLLFELKYR